MSRGPMMAAPTLPRRRRTTRSRRDDGIGRRMAGVAAKNRRPYESIGQRDRTRCSIGRRRSRALSNCGPWGDRHDRLAGASAGTDPGALRTERWPCSTAATATAGDPAPDRRRNGGDLNKDWEAFEKCWVHEPYLRRVGWWSLGGVTYREGWEGVRPAGAGKVPDDPEPNRSAVEVRAGELQRSAWATRAWPWVDVRRSTRRTPARPTWTCPACRARRASSRSTTARGGSPTAATCIRSVHQESAPLLQVDEAGRGRLAQCGRGPRAGSRLRPGDPRAAAARDPPRRRCAAAGRAPAGVPRWPRIRSRAAAWRRSSLQADADAVGRTSAGSPPTAGLVFVAINDAALAGERLEAGRAGRRAVGGADAARRRALQGAVRAAIRRRGRLAQLVERLVYTEDVGGSKSVIAHQALTRAWCCPCGRRRRTSARSP